MKFGMKYFTLLLFLVLTISPLFAHDSNLPSNETLQELEQMYETSDPTGNSPMHRAGPPVGPPIGGTPIGEVPIAAIAIISFAYILVKTKNKKEVI